MAYRYIERAAMEKILPNFRQAALALARLGREHGVLPGPNRSTMRAPANRKHLAWVRVRCSTMRASLAFTFAASVSVMACGDGDDAPSDPFAPEPVACGDLTCSAEEMCVVPRRLEPWFEPNPQTESCAPIPAGCEGLELCECAPLEHDYQGLAVIGCSLLGERSIYVADVTCGDRRCNDDEYCLMVAASLQEPPSSRECRLLPAECTPAAEFCGADGCVQSISVEGFARGACLESDDFRAVQVSPTG